MGVQVYTKMNILIKLFPLIFLCGKAEEYALESSSFLLYLGDHGILSVPSFEKLDCDLQTPASMYVGYGTIVRDPVSENMDRLLVCDEDDCFIQTDQGWNSYTVHKNLLRRSAAASGDGKGGQLVTGGYKGFYISSSMRYNELGWSAGPELPEEKEYHCQVEVDDKVVVIGGRGGGNIATPLTYILEEDNWRQSEKMVTARDGHSCAVLNKNVYAIGGYSYWGGGYVTSVEVFDSETETWTAAPDLPYELAFAQAFVHDASVYIIGGYNGSVYNKNVLKLHEDGWDIVTEIEPMGDRSIFPALVLDENTFNCI